MPPPAVLLLLSCICTSTFAAAILCRGSPSVTIFASAAGRRSNNKSGIFHPLRTACPISCMSERDSGCVRSVDSVGWIICHLAGNNHWSITAFATASVILGGTLMPIMYFPILSVFAW